MLTCRMQLALYQRQAGFNLLEASKRYNKHIKVAHFCAFPFRKKWLPLLLKQTQEDKNSCRLEYVDFGIPVFDRDSCPCLVCVEISFGAGRIYKQHFCLSGMVPTSFKIDPPLNLLPQAFTLSVVFTVALMFLSAFLLPPSFGLLS